MKHTQTTYPKAKRQSPSTPKVKVREVQTGEDIEKGEEIILDGLRRAVKKLHAKQRVRAAD